MKKLSLISTCLLAGLLQASICKAHGIFQPDSATFVIASNLPSDTAIYYSIKDSVNSSTNSDKKIKLVREEGVYTLPTINNNQSINLYLSNSDDTRLGTISFYCENSMQDRCWLKHNNNDYIKSAGYKTNTKAGEKTYHLYYSKRDKNTQVFGPGDTVRLHLDIW